MRKRIQKDTQEVSRSKVFWICWESLAVIGSHWWSYQKIIANHSKTEHSQQMSTLPIPTSLQAATIHSSNLSLVPGQLQWCSRNVCLSTALSWASCDLRKTSAKTVGHIILDIAFLFWNLLRFASVWKSLWIPQFWRTAGRLFGGTLWPRLHLVYARPMPRSRSRSGCVSSRVVRCWVHVL